MPWLPATAPLRGLTEAETGFFSRSRICPPLAGDPSAHCRTSVRRSPQVGAGLPTLHPDPETLFLTPLLFVTPRLSRRWAGSVRWALSGGRARQVDRVQLQGQPAGGAERPAARQARVRLLHQDVGTGLRGDRGDAVLLPAQRHQGAIWAVLAGDGPGSAH